MNNWTWLPYENDPLPAAAQSYAEHGLRIFPLHSVLNGQCTCGNLCHSPGKHPRTEHGVDDARSDVSQVAAWWEIWPQANIGLGLGNGLIVLDEDGEGGRDQRIELEQVNGPLPLTLRSRTGRGLHWFWRVPEDFKARGKLAPKVDLKHKGGYVVAPPSIHHSGRRYAWESTIAPLDAPPWLLAKMRATEPVPEPVPYDFNRMTPNQVTGREKFAQAVLKGVAERVARSGKGERNSVLHWAWCRMAELADVIPKPDARAELLRAAIACGLPETEALQVLR